MLTQAILLSLTATLTPPASAQRPPLARPTVVAQGGEWRGQPAPPPPEPNGWGHVPPPPAVERVKPRRGWVWVEGGYEWRGRQYVRLRGHWEHERPGRQWHSGHWEWRGDRYAWVPGVWVEGPAYTPPPAMVVETPTPPPPPPAAAPAAPPARPGFIWIPGAQEWRGDRYMWVEGHWERERAGDTWRAGHWDREGDRHAWHPGGWEHGERGPGPGFPAAGGLVISGRIVDQMGRPAAGIAVVLAGSSEGRAVTDGNGQYAFRGLVPGSYAVRPNDPRCGFGPDVVNLNNLGSSTVQNFNANCR